MAELVVSQCPAAVCHVSRAAAVSAQSSTRGAEARPQALQSALLGSGCRLRLRDGRERIVYPRSAAAAERQQARRAIRCQVSTTRSEAVVADGQQQQQNGEYYSSLSQVCAVLGTQWGDEGKGKLVDILARRYDVVARCQVLLRLFSSVDFIIWILSSARQNYSNFSIFHSKEPIGEPF